MSPAFPLAANDNDPLHFDNCDNEWTYSDSDSDYDYDYDYDRDYDEEERDEDIDDRTITEIEWLCSTRPTHVRFSPADAVNFGFETNVVSIEYLDYLMGNLVADEDWDASQALKRRYGDI